MATAELTRTRVRVPMVVPPFALVVSAVADLRGDPDPGAELVDQVHHREVTRVLGSRGDWHFVHAQDGYFGWIADLAVQVMPGARGGRLVGRALAPVYAKPDLASAVLAHLPAGTSLSREQHPAVEGPWVRVAVNDTGHPGYVSLEDAVLRDDLPHRPPTPADLIATAESFLGTPYLWGGTSALGLDCSGLVQQVYRLNGVGLPRDADQQALAGRAASGSRAGDLLFFGSPNVTHVGMYAGDGAMIHAPQRGAFVERRLLSEFAREPVATRRYLVDEA